MIAHKCIRSSDRPLWRLLRNLLLEHLPLLLLQELSDVEGDLVITIQVLRVAIIEIYARLRKLGELVDDKTHLKVGIAGEGFVRSGAYQIKSP